MTRDEAIETLIQEGFDRKFAEKAVDWFIGHPTAFQEAVKFVEFVKDNEYLIRHGF